jgi:hypothetical protein
MSCAKTADGDYATRFSTEYDDKTRWMRFANCSILLRCCCDAMVVWNGWSPK